MRLWAQGGVDHDAAAQPGAPRPAEGFLPGNFTDTDFGPASMAAGASRPCAHGDGKARCLRTHPRPGQAEWWPVVVGSGFSGDIKGLIGWESRS